MHRTKILEEIRHNPEIQVLIIGAGINGVGTFRDLSYQGIDVLMVDKDDFCAGASAASSHMVHGGIRYLENGEFRLVREAVEERNRLLQNAPHAVKPLATVIPIFKFFSGIFNAPLKFAGLLDRPSERGAFVIKAGLTMYDAFTGLNSRVPRHRFEGRGQSLKRFPKLNKNVAFTATYYDAAMPSPERICLELIFDGEAAHQRAFALNYVAAESHQNGTVLLRDQLTDELISVQPQLVINAAGPWIDFANAALGQKTEFIGGTKGSHLVLDHPELHAAIAGHEFFFENDDGRIVLIFPLMDKVLVGTSDIPIDDPEEARCTEAEVEYFIDMLDKVFPAMMVDRSQIIFRFSGVRPLPAMDAATAGQISRDHHIRTLEPEGERPFPILSLIGGKWTTFRAFSEQVTDRVLQRFSHDRQCNTTNLPIGGGRGFPQSATKQARWLETLQHTVNLPMPRLKHLFERYGTRAKVIAGFLAAGQDAPLKAHSGYSEREILFLIEQEKALHLEDVLLRRTLLGMLGEVTPELLLELAALMGQACGWSKEDQAEELARTIALLADKHGVMLSLEAEKA